MTTNFNTSDGYMDEEEKVHFVPPAIQDNPDGWGPCQLPDQFKDIPYQPFSKGDRLGKVKDDLHVNSNSMFLLTPFVLTDFWLDRSSLSR